MSTLCLEQSLEHTVILAMPSFPLGWNKRLPNGQLTSAECGGPGCQPTGEGQVSLAEWKHPGIPKCQLSLGHEGTPVPWPNSIHAIYLIEL